MAVSDIKPMEPEVYVTHTFEMKSLPHIKTYNVSITKASLFILYKKIRSSFFWDVSSVDC